MPRVYLLDESGRLRYTSGHAGDPTRYGSARRASSSHSSAYAEQRLHVYQDDSGESLTKPCAEVLFTEETVEVLLDQGLMPLISFKNQDQIRLARIQSLASPLASLMGQWDTA